MKRLQDLGQTAGRVCGQRLPKLGVVVRDSGNREQRAAVSSEEVTLHLTLRRRFDPQHGAVVFFSQNIDEAVGPLADVADAVVEVLQKGFAP